jgi:hypothetical protein
MRIYAEVIEYEFVIFIVWGKYLRLKFVIFVI